MKTADWHNRYLTQARWTKNLRRFIFDKLKAAPGQTVLEVGSGTGALFSDIVYQGLRPFGVEIDLDRCEFSMSHSPDAPVTCADGFRLPFKNGSFDFTVCHYFLLWLKNPQEVIKEMKRVTKAGGYVVASAEPDYLSRIDYPELFQNIGTMQNHSLAFQGVNLTMGRKLGWMFREAGLKGVHLGLLAGEWRQPSLDAFESEWDMIAYDLGGMAPIERILEIKEEAMQSWLKGQATIFIPTFYAHGRL